MKFVSANRITTDGTPRFAASHLGLFCLPMSHKKDAGLIWVNSMHFYYDLNLHCNCMQYFISICETEIFFLKFEEEILPNTPEAYLRM